MAFPSSPRDPFQPGSLINEKYRIIEQIGAGGMGKVYKATQLPLERIVAIKVVHPHLGEQGSGSSGSRGEGETFQRRFFREASALSQLQSRNIVTVFDYGRVDGQDAFFMVMECLQGAPLSAQLRGGRRITIPTALDMLRQIGRGLREVHKQGMVHRDLKPANIFLAKEADEITYKLLDFGLVKQVTTTGNPDELTAAGALLGSPTYMAPEQIEGGSIDPRADLYSLGALTFHCLTGRPPFEGSLTQVMIQHVHKEAPSLVESCREEMFPPELEQLVARCLSKRPEDRYQSIDAMLEDLQMCEAHYGIGTPASLSGFRADTQFSVNSEPISTKPPSTSVPIRSMTKVGDEHGSLVSLTSPELATRVDPSIVTSKQRLRLWLPIATIVVLFGVGGLALRSASSSRDVIVKNTIVSSAISSTEAPPQVAQEILLSLNSIPSGAQIMEGEQMLGTTPLDLPLKPGSKRSLWLKMEGFEPFSLESLPTESTRMVIPLKSTEVSGNGKAGKKAPVMVPGVRNPVKNTATQEQPPTLPAPPAIRMTRLSTVIRLLSRRIPPILLLATLSTLVLQAQADDVADEADLYFRTGAEKFVNRDFRGALEYFLRSNRLVRNRNVMFNIARSYEQLNLLNDAFRYYTTALEGETDPNARKAVEAALRVLQPKVALVEVQTDPPGANIYIERKDLGARGSSPRTLAFPSGKLKVFADLPGYEDAPATEVLLEVGKTVKVHLSLKKIVGIVQVSGAPREVTVSSDGGPFEPLLAEKISLTPGQHQLILRLPGHQDDVHLIDIKADATTLIEARLQPLVGSLVVATDERDAEILVDGRQVGFTPAVVAVPVGIHKITLRLPGFREVTRELEILQGEPTRIEADLRQVEEVSAVSRTAEAVGDAPSSVSVLSRQDLRAFAFPTIAEALRGVRGFYTGDSRSYGSVGVRGFSRPGDYGQRILTLLDGYPTNDNYIGSSYIGLDNRVDLEDIERIEVIRGPGSVVYGTNAFFGVVNLVPRQGRGRTGGEVGLSLFDYGIARGRARADVALGKDASAWISVMGAQGPGRDYFFQELVSPSYSGNSNGLDGVRAASAQASLRWKNLSVQSFYTSREKSVPTAAYGAIPGDPRTKLVDTRGFVELRYEPRLSSSSQILVRTHADLYNFHGYYPYGAAASDLGKERFEGRWFGGEVRGLFTPSESLRMIIGGEGNFHTKAKIFGEDSSGEYLNSNHPFRAAGGYVSADWSPAEIVKISAGARLDYFSTFDGISINPRLAFILRPAKKSSFKIMGAKAFRAPSIYEFYYNDGGLTQIPSEGLKPETIYSGELEFTQRFSTAITFTAATFLSRVNDLITPRGSGTNVDPIYYENSKTPTQILGIEGELRRDWRQGWMLSASGSLQKATYQQGKSKTIQLREVPDSPFYLASLRGAIPLLNRALTLASRLSLEGPRYDRMEHSTDEPQGKSEVVAIWDVILSGEETRYGTSYAIGVYNLFDWRYRLPLSSEFPQRRLLQNGRTVLASLKVAF